MRRVCVNSVPCQSRKSFDNETLRSIGNRLSLARGDRTQAQFAKALGISRSALANYEAGRRIPNSAVFSRIEKEAGISKRELLFGRNYDEYTIHHMELEERILHSLREKNPGSIPKFMISDDELLIVRALRGIASPAKVLTAIADELELAVKADVQPTPVATYEEQFIQPLRNFAEKDDYDWGADPDRMDWIFVRDQAQLAVVKAPSTKRPKKGP